MAMRGDASLESSAEKLPRRMEPDLPLRHGGTTPGGGGRRLAATIRFMISHGNYSASGSSSNEQSLLAYLGYLGEPLTNPTQNSTDAGAVDLRVALPSLAAALSLDLVKQSADGLYSICTLTIAATDAGRRRTSRQGRLTLTVLLAGLSKYQTPENIERRPTERELKISLTNRRA